MALNSKQGSPRPSADTFTPVSAKTEWQVLHDNAKSTATTVASPLNQSQAGAGWVAVPGHATRLDLRARSTAGGTKTTDPVAAVIGYFGPAFDGDSPSQSDGRVEVLHESITCTLAKKHDDADGTDSAAWDYGATQNNGGDGYDLRGATYILVLGTTAAVGPDNVDIEGRFLN